MRTLISISISVSISVSIAAAAAAVAVLVGCHSPSTVGTRTAAAAAAVRPPFHPMLITTLGSETTPDGAWRISVSNASLDVSRSISAQGEDWTTSGWATTSWRGDDRPPWWTAHAGWFVWVESESRVWAYSGDRILMLLAFTNLSGANSCATIYDSRFPCTVPAEVLSRLSEPARRAIQTHD